MLACAPIVDLYLGYFGLCIVYPLVVGSHMVGQIANKMCAHEDMPFHKGEYVTHLKVQGFHVILAI